MGRKELMCCERNRWVGESLGVGGSPQCLPGRDCGEQHRQAANVTRPAAYKQATAPSRYVRAGATTLTQLKMASDKPISDNLWEAARNGRTLFVKYLLEVEKVNVNAR